MTALICLGILLYFAPYFAAIGRRNSMAIFVLNVTLGWTILGWAGALIWALMSPKAQDLP